MRSRCTAPASPVSSPARRSSAPPHSISMAVATSARLGSGPRVAYSEPIAQLSGESSTSSM